MIELTIDGKTVQVPEGSNVLDAALKADIVVPHFCYHPAMGAVGACRLCAVEFKGNGGQVDMSCMRPAEDGMEVSTTSDRATNVREEVVEMLMLDHPHDCPVCDEGGECMLQEMTVASGHGNRRYEGRKRTFRDQDLGVFIKHELNRCITCYRCSRFYQELAGGRDFGVMGSRNRVYFGRYEDGQLESEFSGNLVDICPTGVFTDKTFRFKARRWDLESAEAVCVSCSLGCNTYSDGHFGEWVRVRGRHSELVNGYFICDRGRFGYDYANISDRVRKPLERTNGAASPEWKEGSRDDLLDDLTATWQEIVANEDASSVAALTSPRLSLEAGVVLHAITAAYEGMQLASFESPEDQRSTGTVFDVLESDPIRVRSLQDVQNADCIVLLGADPTNQAPMLDMAIRRSVRGGGRFIACTPRKTKIEEIAHYSERQPTAAVEDFLQRLATGEGELEEASSWAREATSLVLVASANWISSSGLKAIATSASEFDSDEAEAGLFFTLPGANGLGLTALQREIGQGTSFDDILSGIEAGDIRALLVVEADPIQGHPDRQRVEDALDSLDHLAVVDHLPTRTRELADLVLPIATVAESEGTFVNQEGRAQLSRQAYKARAVPPGRTELLALPPAPRQSWEVLAAMLERATGEAPDNIRQIRVTLAGDFPRFHALETIDKRPEGARIVAGEFAAGADTSAPPSTEGASSTELPSGEEFRLLPVELIFGSEALTRHAPSVQKVAPEPWIELAREDAEELDLEDGQEVSIGTASGTLTAPLRVSDALARRHVAAPVGLLEWPLNRLAAEQYDRVVRVTALTEDD